MIPGESVRFGSVRQVLEPALAFARAHLRSDPRSDEANEAALKALTACRQYIEVLRTPHRQQFDATRRIGKHLHKVQTGTVVVEEGNLASCKGDSAQIIALLELFISNVWLEEESLLAVSYGEQEVPAVLLELDGPGHFREPFSFGYDLNLSFEQANARWTAATGGGRVDRTPAGLTLRLAGVRQIPGDVPGADELYPVVVKAHQQLLGVQAALHSGGGEVADALALIEELLPEAPDVCEPLNLAAAFEQSREQLQASLDQAAIRIEVYGGQDLPPIRAARDRIAALYEFVLRYALGLFPKGGGITALFDYDERGRMAGVVIAMSGETAAQPCHEAAMRRIVEEQHAGSLDLAFQPKEATITIGLPDTVGQELDAWIPGWGNFSSRSRQMLRLLKGSAQAPPEELILTGVLESELQDWLLPHLSTAPAPKLAGDLLASGAGAPAASAERLQKALTQVSRAKPKKEVTQPGYAAELIWAFRQDERHRSAIGAENLSEQDIGDLCAALLANPLDHIHVLRILAKAEPQRS